MTLRVDRHPISVYAQRTSARGEWYVSRDVGDNDHQYLHADGIWRSSTFSGPGWGDPTGYFNSENEARAALATVCGKTKG